MAVNRDQLFAELEALAEAEIEAGLMPEYGARTSASWSNTTSIS
jgi:hypothetical protein